MNHELPDVPIYTVRYGDFPYAELESVLRRTKGLLVDVRTAPWSQNPDYQLPTLQARLKSRYLHNTA